MIEKLYSYPESKNCPIDTVFKIIGHNLRTHLKRDVQDQTQFNRILQNTDGISPKVITQRMKTLQRLEIVERKIVLACPIHIEYRLTDLERALEPALLFNGIYADYCF